MMTPQNMTPLSAHPPGPSIAGFVQQQQQPQQMGQDSRTPPTPHSVPPTSPPQPGPATQFEQRSAVPVTAGQGQVPRTVPGFDSNSSPNGLMSPLMQPSRSNTSTPVQPLGGAAPGARKPVGGSIMSPPPQPDEEQQVREQQQTAAVIMAPIPEGQQPLPVAPAADGRSYSFASSVPRSPQLVPHGSPQMTRQSTLSSSPSVTMHAYPPNQAGIMPPQGRAPGMLPSQMMSGQQQQPGFGQPQGIQASWAGPQGSVNTGAGAGRGYATPPPQGQPSQPGTISKLFKSSKAGVPQAQPPAPPATLQKQQDSKSSKSGGFLSAFRNRGSKQPDPRGPPPGGPQYMSPPGGPGPQFMQQQPQQLQGGPQQHMPAPYMQYQHQRQSPPKGNSPAPSAQEQRQPPFVSQDVLAPLPQQQQQQQPQGASGCHSGLLLLPRVLPIRAISPPRPSSAPKDILILCRASSSSKIGSSNNRARHGSRPSQSSRCNPQLLLLREVAPPRRKRGTPRAKRLPANAPSSPSTTRSRSPRAMRRFTARACGSAAVCRYGQGSCPPWLRSSCARPVLRCSSPAAPAAAAAAAAGVYGPGPAASSSPAAAASGSPAAAASRPPAAAAAAHVRKLGPAAVRPAASAAAMEPATIWPGHFTWTGAMGPAGLVAIA